MKHLEHVRDPWLRLLYAAWLDWRGQRHVPDRRDIDPAAIAPVLPHIWLLTHEPATGRFRYRLAGEHIDAIHGRNLKGLDQEATVGPKYWPAVRARHFATLEGPAAVHNTGSVYLENGRSVLGERLALPLTDGSAEIRLILGATVYDWRLLDGPRTPAEQQMTLTITPLQRPSRPLAADREAALSA